MALPTFPKPTVAALAILAALLAILLVARHALDRPKPAARFAHAILAGQVQARADLAEEAGDRDLADDEADAGALWAKAHRRLNPDECPLDPPALRKGCAAYVTGHAR